MIVLHGVAELADTVSEYTLALDNVAYEVSGGDETLHDNIAYEEYNSTSKTDGTAAGEGAKVKIKIKTSNIESMAIKSGYCNGSKNSLLSSEIGGLEKEPYLEEVAAFMSSGRVDFSLKTVGYNSPIDGSIFTTWVEDSPEGGFPINEVTIEKGEKDDEFVLEYDTKTVVDEQTGCDWFIGTSLELLVDIVTKTGAIAKDQEISYKHNDAPIVTKVTIDGGKYLTFDNDIAVIGGWWESSDIPVRTRQIAKSGISTRDSMFRYKIFGSISPKVFSSNIRNMVFTAVRADSSYSMDKVLTNNLYECPDLAELSISSSGPSITGGASVIPNNELGTISIDTSSVQTAHGEMHVVLSSPGSMNSCKFEIKAGFAPTANFIVAGVDARVLYNQISGQGTTAIMGSNVDNGLVGFHLYVNGLQGYLIDDVWNPLYAVLGLMSMGITCALTGNMLEFVYYLYYESTKSILWDSERRIVMSEITGTQEQYLSSMAQAQVGVDAETRKKMARQWLEMIDSRYMKMSSPDIGRTFFLQVYCSFVPFYMPDTAPYTLGLPMYGVPMGDGIVDTVNTPDQILTDEVKAMMKKNAFFSMFRTRMDWAMALGGKLGEYATHWAWGGTLVTVSIGGQHQELYASSDPGYSINGSKHRSVTGDVVPDVAIPGEIGEAWNEIKEARDGASRFAYWNGQYVRTGTDAEASIAAWRDPGVAVMYGMINSVVINVDNDTVTINGSDTRDAIIYRPNPNVIIAFEKQ